MSQLTETWSKETGKIFKGVLLYSIAGILYSIFEPIDSLMSSFNGLSSMMGGEPLGGMDALTVICYLMLVGIIAGYFLFLQGLGSFSNIVATDDSVAVKKIRTGVILGLAAAVFGFIPYLGWVGGILNIIGFILMMMGYSALKNSATFPQKAREGAARLFMAMILLVVGVLVGFIPIAGGFIEMVLDIIAFILTLVGWATIKNTVPAE